MATITYKCPNCGGDLRFVPDRQNYRCDFCGSEFLQSQLEEMTPDSASVQYEQAPQTDTGAQSASQDSMAGAAGTGAAGAGTAGAGAAGSAAGAESGAGGGAVIYTCPSCGAEIVTDETTAATFCYYCHNPVILEGRLSGEYLPDQVIPFQYGREKAVEAFMNYVGGKKFVPKAFFAREQIEKLTGVYYPFWIYDCQLQGSMEAKGTKVRVWMRGDTQYTETSVFRVVRGGRVQVENQVRNALGKSDHRLIEAVLPYRLEEKKAFSMAYLQGFVAEKRDIEKGALSAELQNKAREAARQSVRNSISGYEAVTVQNENFTPVAERWQYLLLPVWVLTYGGLNGKKYYFAMNGQTGEVQGKLPVSYGKLTLWSALLGAALFAGTLALQFFMF